MNIRRNIKSFTPLHPGSLFRLGVTGFTLIELLVAITIFSIIIMGIYSAFQTGILSYGKLDSNFEVYQGARVILNRMELDLRNVFSYQKDDSRFLGGLVDIEFFTTADAYSKGLSLPNVYHVKYSLENQSLKRLSAGGDDALKVGLDVEGKELSSSIKEFSLRYIALPSTGSQVPYEEQENWPKDDIQKKAIPIAVKIKLVVMEKDRRGADTGRVTEFNKVVALE